MNTKTGKWELAASTVVIVVLGGCTSVRYTGAELEARERVVRAEAPTTGGPSHSSEWAGVLPADAVNDSPLAMAEYNAELNRNDLALGIVPGPAGEPMSFYASAEPPSLYWQYQFTLPANVNTVTVFRRGGEAVFVRPGRGYYRIP